MHNPISPIIKHRFPGYLPTDYERLYDFVTYYYEFLETLGNPLDVLEKFSYNLESNHEVDIYVDKVLADLGYDVALEPTIPKSELVIHLRDFYLGRGSENSFKFLFKVLYGIDPEIEYPRDRLLIPSQATYTGNHYVYTTASNFGTDDFTTLLEQVSSFDVIITGITSGEISSVESMFVEVHNNQFYLKVQLDSRLKIFLDTEAVRIYSEGAGVQIAEQLVNLVTIAVDDPGYGYTVGDSINISNTNIVGRAEVNSLRDGGVEDLTIVDGGAGYKVNDQIYAHASIRGHSFSAVVDAVDNTINYLDTPDHDELDIQTGDFTCECWVYRTQQGIEEVLIGNRPDYPNDNKGWEWKITADNKLAFSILEISDEFEVLSSSSIPFKTWTFLTTVRDSGTLRHYINGVPSGSGDISNGTHSSNNVRIGIGRSDGGIFIGYMDELRITKGVARYTNKAFEVPKGSLPESEDYFANVSLLMHFDGAEGTSTFTDSSANTKTITLNGNIWITTGQSRFNTSSGFFSGYGEISGVRIYSPGYNFEEIPLLYIESENGTGADIVAVSTSIGQIESVEIIEPFVDTSGTPVATVDGTGSDATFTVTTDSIIYSEQPFHKSFEGMLGVNCTVIDSYYWQQFSYLIRSGISRTTYDEAVNEWLHPAGFVRFAVFDNFFSGIFNQTEYGGFTGTFYLTIVKLIHGYDPSFMINPLYNLNWFKDLSNFRNANYHFDVYQEEWLDGAEYYMSPALDADIIKVYPFVISDYLVNPFDNLDWVKNFVSFDHPNNIWEDNTLEDVSDNSILMSEALSIEILIYYYQSNSGETLEDLDLSTQSSMDVFNYTGQILNIESLEETV